MSVHTIQLDEEQERYIQEGVRAGRFADDGDALTNGLRLLQERDAEYKSKVRFLREACDEALASLDQGKGTEFESVDAFNAWLQGVADQVYAEHVAQ